MVLQGRVILLNLFSRLMLIIFLLTNMATVCISKQLLIPSHEIVIILCLVSGNALLSLELYTCERTGIVEIIYIYINSGRLSQSLIASAVSFFSGILYA
jgi:hypothetical protein